MSACDCFCGPNLLLRKLRRNLLREAASRFLRDWFTDVRIIRAESQRRASIGVLKIGANGNP
eukprot:1040003-Prorocentrum_minimum.AAC.1